MTLAWFVALPVVVAVFAGTQASVLTAALCLTALASFGYLRSTGHVFPMATEQSLSLWVAVTAWAVITTTGISIFSNHRFHRTVTAYQSEITRRTRVEQTCAVRSSAFVLPRVPRRRVLQRRVHSWPR